MTVIAQNGPKLKAIADEITSIKNEVTSLYNQLYDDIDQNLGTADETTKNWYGPRAEGCKKAAAKLKPQFQQMSTNLQQLSETVDGQATAWANQQNRKY